MPLPLPLALAAVGQTGWIASVGGALAAAAALLLWHRRVRVT